MKHFNLPPGTHVTDIEFISNDLRTVFPKVLILEGTADELAEGVVRAQFLNVESSGRHRVHLDCGSLRLSGDIYVAITLPAGSGVQSVGDGAGIGGMQLAAPDGNNFIASAADGSFEPIDVNMAVYFNAGQIGKAAPTLPPDAGVSAPVHTYMRVTRLGRPIAISFGMSEAAKVRITIFDVAGRAVRRFPAETIAQGRYDRTWDGLDDAGQMTAAGVYVVHLDMGKKRLSEKVIIVR